jgi:sugar/nucleoside kinase (ribokinase family)
MPDFWVIGPIAWDTVVQVPRLPESGGFVQADQLLGRPGGAGANVAIALASTGVMVHMAGYVGDDDSGTKMRAVLTDSRIDIRHVATLSGHTSEVMILIEPSGERTMIGLYPDLLHDAPVPVAAIQPGDVVYFAAWRDVFLPAMKDIADKGALVTTVPAPVMPPDVPANYVIGSRAQYEGQDPGRWLMPSSGRLRAQAVTRSADGALLYEADGMTTFPARLVPVVDTTGAGDAFAAGFLYKIADGHAAPEAVDVGIAWAAAAVQQSGSIPPPWSAVCDSVQSSGPR